MTKVHDEISRSIEKGENEKAGILIRRFLQGSSDPEARLQACQWYWKLGRSPNALRVLKLDADFPRELLADAPDGQRFLWAARILNHLGASYLALHLASLIRATKATDHHILGNIFFSNLCLHEAMDHYLAMDALDRGKYERAERYRRIVKTMALAASGDEDRAIEDMTRLHESCPEPDLANQVCLYWGVILAKAGRFEEAFEKLAAVGENRELIKTSSDRGAFHKWLGYLYGKKGDLSQATRHFLEADQILFTKSHRLEPWLELIRLRSEVVEVPEKWLRKMRHYPGLTPGLQAYFGNRAPAWFGSDNSSIKICLESDEYFHDGSWRLGIPKEFLLLAYLRLTGSWSINAIRLQSLLWPDEVFSFPQLEGRLKKLIQRLRVHYGIDITIHEGHYALSRSACESIGVYSAGEKRPQLLREVGSFRALDVEQRYRVSRTQALLIISKWTRDGWVIKNADAKGRSSSYLVRGVPGTFPGCG